MRIFHQTQRLEPVLADFLSRVFPELEILSIWGLIKKRKSTLSIVANSEKWLQYKMKCN